MKMRLTFSLLSFISVVVIFIFAITSSSTKADTELRNSPRLPDYSKNPVVISDRIAYMMVFRLVHSHNDNESEKNVYDPI